MCHLIYIEIMIAVTWPLHKQLVFKSTSEKGLTCRNGDKHAQIGSRQVIYRVTLSENIARTETSLRRSKCYCWPSKTLRTVVLWWGALSLGIEVPRWNQSGLRTARWMYSGGQGSTLRLFLVEGWRHPGDCWWLLAVFFHPASSNFE